MPTGDLHSSLLQLRGRWQPVPISTTWNVSMANACSFPSPELVLTV